MLPRLYQTLIVVLALLPGPARADEVAVFAAASLKNALDEAAAVWSARTGHYAAISYAGSSALARQIENGAPVGLFLSANRAWMDHLAERGLLAEGTRTDLAGNRLVLIAAADDPVSVDLAPGLDLAPLLSDSQLAVAQTDAVPAGIYARAALTALGAWDGVRERAAQAENVRAALRLVALGEARLGVVYATDAAAEPRVRVVGTFPSVSHPPIRYPGAVIAEFDTAAARDLLAYLAGPEGRDLFRRHGFTPPDGAP